jgi:hypothetical protein
MMEPPLEKNKGFRAALQKSAPFRIGLLSFGALAALVGVAGALQHYLVTHIPRLPTEQRLVLRLEAPYGSVDLRSGTPQGDVATVETLDEDANAKNSQWSHGIRNETIGLLRIGIGTDEGRLQGPPLAMWYANSGISLASAHRIQSDMGSQFLTTLAYPPLPYPRFFSYPQARVVSTDGENFTATAAAPSTRIRVTKEIPVELWADLGFGESSLDLSGLALTNASIETGASRATIRMAEVNPQAMGSCTVKAGIGQCSFTGISNLNANRFAFHGGVGSYHLGFEGHLTRDIDAIVDVGLGMCTISVPPTAGRVQVFYDESLLNSFSFTGLAVRRDGYATSVGFDRATGPTLTLHLSSGAGKMSVSYH